MTACNESVEVTPTVFEVAIFEVKKENVKQAILLSKRLFDEMNANEKLLVAHQILQKTDNEEEVCWHLTWKNLDAVKTTTAKWHSFPSAKAIEEIVGKKHYYGHFVEVVASKS